MNAPKTTPTQDSSSSSGGPQRFAAVRMPIEEPVEDFTEAVQKLKQCSSTELRRARQHHRRALESLQNGGYCALSDRTRDDLISRLKSNLSALNRALEPPSEGSETHEKQENTPASTDSFSSRFRALFQGLW